MTRVAIVGSRRRTDLANVEAAVAELPADTVVVSGKCAGPDIWAAAAARRRGLEVVEHEPDLPPTGSPRWMFTRAYHARNQVVVDDCDRVIALVAPNRKGGTEGTIRRALAAGKQVDIR